MNVLPDERASTQSTQKILPVCDSLFIRVYFGHFDSSNTRVPRPGGGWRGGGIRNLEKTLFCLVRFFFPIHLTVWC